MRFLLTSRFQFQLRYSLEILAEFFNVLQPELYAQVEPLLQDFLNLRLDKKTPKNLFQKCFSLLVARISPQNILKLAPITLNFDLDDKNFEDAHNLWLLPYFNKHLRATPISFFISAIVPLLQALSVPQSSATFTQLFAHLSGQLLDLLPYCHILDVSPIPLLQLLSQAELSPTIIKFLEQIALYSFTNKVFQKELSQFAQSFIPILAKSALNESLLSIRALSFICDQAYLKRVVAKNLERLLKSEKDWKRTMEVLIEVLTGTAMDANLYGQLQQLVQKSLALKEEKLAYKLLLKCSSKLHASFYPSIL